MRKKYLHRIILYVIALCLMLVCLVGCTSGKNDETESQQESQMENTDEQFIIMAHDMQKETMMFYSITSGMEYFYEYGFSTKFKDKYGNLGSAADFTLGRVVTIAFQEKENYLTEVQLSDEVWEHTKVHRFQIDEAMGVFTIGETKYSIREEVKVFSDERESAFSEISEDDILTVIGSGRKILSVIVTTGHGTLSLKNTSLFEDSLLQLNHNIFAMITPNMKMEVPEGEYTLKVANDGWGGSTKIEIVRGETTEIDLETLKGEGRKKGRITFEIDAENVKVRIDYKLVDHTQPVELTYGLHVLQIEAKGYEAWKKYLSVNSEEATLLIELTEKEGEKDTVDDTEKEDTESLESTEI